MSVRSLLISLIDVTQHSDDSSSRDSNPPTTSTLPLKEQVTQLRRCHFLLSDQISEIYEELATVQDNLLGKQVQLYRANRLICQLSARTTPLFSTPSNPHPLAPLHPLAPRPSYPESPLHPLDTLHQDTLHPDTLHPDTFHPSPSS